MVDETPQTITPACALPFFEGGRGICFSRPLHPLFNDKSIAQRDYFSYYLKYALKCVLRNQCGQFSTTLYIEQLKMNTINANELKKRGVSAIESALLHDSDVAISVRGQTRFVVVNLDYFQQLREYELEKAVRDAKEDLAAGRFVVETAAQHKERIMAKYGL